MPKTFQLGPASVLWAGRAEGHLGHNPPRASHDERCCGPEPVARRSVVKPGQWKYLAQVHGDVAVIVDAGSEPGAEADASVTNDASVTLAIATADCAPVAFSSPEGIVAAAHAGWAGLHAGILASTVQSMRALGATSISAALGPCIHVECYEFEDEALSRLEARWGSTVAGETSEGSLGFDLPEAVAVELGSVGVELAHVESACTGCSGEYFSHRKTGTDDRQVMLVHL